eukprot:1932989-Prymnesium_polylepis.1
MESVKRDASPTKSRLCSLCLASASTARPLGSLSTGRSISGVRVYRWLCRLPIIRVASLKPPTTSPRGSQRATSSGVIVPLT